MKKLLIGAAATMAVLALPILADTPMEEKPGYVDFGELASAYGDPRVKVNIGSNLLRLASVVKHDNPAAGAALRDMEAVRVHVYDTHGDTAPAAERMDDVRETLTADTWERIVEVREEDKQVDIYLKYDEERIHGLTVMAVDHEEAVFVNVLGDINPEELQSVMDQVDVDIDL